LALNRDGSELVIAQQILYSLAQTTFDDVHWGNLITNNLRVLQTDNVLSAKADLLKGQRLHYLGDVGNAAGDPAHLAISQTGKVIVALGGVGDILLGNEKDYHWQRLRVGRHPVAVVIGSDGKQAYVANRFADSIAVVDLQKTTATAETSLGPQPQLSARDRGEMLFYDARLAHDGWLSCHSCHSDGHSNGLLNDNLGDGSFGAPKRVLSLLGVGDTAPYAWLGAMPDLESQIQKSILTTMHGPKPSPQQVKDLAAFLRTLRPPPGILKFAAKHDSAGLERGRAVFHQQACTRCHTPPEYTSPGAYDVGFRDEVGNTRFNPPSLRGVSQGGPYLHDNRAATLEEVISKYRHQLKNELTKQDREDLLMFLRSL
ncbi:MAG TPA: cytochrome c peroxidase, partial [Gemmataceae bacterium]|nr:cytochrome c peroxidase [Gemmataceae bacterium]